MDGSKLPALRCGRVDAGGVEASWWSAIKPVLLRETVTGAVERQSTRVKTAWDDHGWRVLFEVEDDFPWANFTDRESPLWEEEVVEMFFDPLGDLESYFEIEINVLGTVKDLVLRRNRNGWRKDFGWRVEGLRSGVRRTLAGWEAELWIPFAALGVAPPVAGTRWRVNFLRIDRPRGPGTEAELGAWSPTGMRQFHRAERFGWVEFTG